ncbi:helix-turn-helix transcriptional regulator [Lacipirellula parvula]|nr:WYL domain-containing protein [Lacipirellula parvula]
MNLKRITRLLQLLQTLQAGQGENADALAKACGMSRRTAFRDLETLREAGVPLQFDKTSGRYSITADYFLRPTNFSFDEALSIVALTSDLGAGTEAPFFGAARSAALKIQGALAADLRKEVQLLGRFISIRLNALDQLKGSEAVYARLVESLAERHVAQIRYQSLTEWEVIETKLRPYQLFFDRHAWYVIGRSSLHSGPRTFNVSRILNIELLDQKYSRPRGFNLERYLGNAWNIMRSSSPDEQVTIRFAKIVATNVSEVEWHKTQRLEWRADGSLDFHARVSGFSEIIWWILGYGEHAEVIRPAKLRKQVATRAENVCKIYARDDNQLPPRPGTGAGARVKQR